MEITNSKTVFIEYSSARKGQHFMTVVQTINHDRVIIGRIYREYEPKTQKSKYMACDFEGNQIFFDTHDLNELKNKFKKSGRFLAEGKLATQKVAKQKNEKFPYSQNALRTHDIKAIREKKFDRGKGITKTPEKQNPSEKTKLIQMEKEQDTKNSIKYQTEPNMKTGDNSNEKSPEQLVAGLHSENINQNVKSLDQRETGSTSENTNQKEQFTEPENNKSDREMELEEIRADNDDREQDIDGPDQDIDL